MGLFIPDLARTEEDFRRVAELISRLSPDGAVPLLGKPGNTTYVLRAEEDRRVINGVCHVEHAPEISHLMVEPNPSAKYGFLFLEQVVEMDLRRLGREHYYAMIPEGDERVLSMFDRRGATRVTGHVRFRKKV